MRHGAHAANAAITDADIKTLKAGGFTSVKLMARHHGVEDMRRIRAEVPDASFHVRLRDSRPVPKENIEAEAERYAAEAVGDIARLWPEALDYTVDNEPNRIWGEGRSADYRDFIGAVHTKLEQKIQARNLSGVRLFFPPISFGNEASAHEWLETCQAVANEYDGLAVTSYWQCANCWNWEQFGGNHIYYRRLFPGKRLVIVEYGNSSWENGKSRAELDALMAAQYPEYLRWLRQFDYIEAAYVFIVGGTHDWAGLAITPHVAAALAIIGKEERMPVTQTAVDWAVFEAAINKEAYHSTEGWTSAQVLALFNVQRTPKYIVLHDTMGAWPSDAQWLSGSNGVGIHFVIAPDGTIYQLSDVDTFVPWHAGCKPDEQRRGHPIRAVWGYGNENFHSVGIERSVLDGHHVTDAQEEATRLLIAFLVRSYPAIQLDTNHIVAHEWLNLKKHDPQNVDFPALLADVQKLLQAPEPAPAPTPIPEPEPQPTPQPTPEPKPKYQYFEETGKWVAGGFFQIFDFEADGFPLTNEMQGTGKLAGYVVQFFEKSVMQWKPGIQPERGAIGRVALDCMGILKWE